MLIGTFVLAGCVPEIAAETPSPTPTSTPVFASEEEALAAAVAAYENYLRVSDEIAADGGANPERLKDLVTDEWYEKELEVIEMIREAGIYQVGETAYRNVELQQLDDLGDSVVELTINACADTTATSFLDQSGSNITPATRISLVTNEVVFRIEREDKLVLVRSSPWQGSSLC